MKLTRLKEKIKHSKTAFFAWARKHLIALSVLFILAFLLLGAILNGIWSFPYFYPFVVLFLAIGGGASLAQRKYCLLMRDTIADVFTLMPFQIARIEYLKWIKHPLNTLIPIGVILIFGVGGSSIYGEMKMTPTFIWCLLVFTLVVFISIQAYLKYIYLARFLYLSSNSNETYTGLPHITTSELPREIDWLKRLGKTISTYQGAFFALGTLYITAFALFCFAPEFGVSRNALIFYFLWGIIFGAIVLTFPFVALLDRHWYKRIEKHVQYSYLGIWRKNKLPFEIDDPLSKLVGELLREQCMNYVFPPKKGSVKRTLQVGYAFLSAAFNFVVSIITILQFSGMTL